MVATSRTAMSQGTVASLLTQKSYVEDLDGRFAARALHCPGLSAEARLQRRELEGESLSLKEFARSLRRAEMPGARLLFQHAKKGEEQLLQSEEIFRSFLVYRDSGELPRERFQGKEGLELLRRVLDGLHSQGEEVTVDSFRSAVLAMRLERLRRDLKRIS